MQALRLKLFHLRGGLPEWLDVHQQVASHAFPLNGVILRHGSAHHDMYSQLRRDLLAFLVCHHALLFHGEVFGGFVRDVFTGLPWHDVDLCFPSKEDILSFKRTLCPALQMLVGERAMGAMVLRLVRVAQHEGYGVVHRHVLHWGDTTIPLDLTWLGDRGRFVSFPATIGSSLGWSLQQGLHVRNLPHSDVGNAVLTVDTIVDTLRSGRDQARFPSHWEWHALRRQYRDRYEQRRNNHHPASSDEDAHDAEQRVHETLTRFQDTLVRKVKALQQRGLDLMPQHEGLRLQDWLDAQRDPASPPEA